MTFPALSHPDASIWRARADALTERARHLVNRLDVWGQYIPPNRRADPERKVWTAPAMRDRGVRQLTAAQLRAHFSGAIVIGLHAQSEGGASAQVSRWCGFDLDAHNDVTAGADRAAHSASAARLRTVLQSRGAEALIEMACDRGGMHVWVRFDHPVPTSDLFTWAQAVQAEAKVSGETFPKQDAATFGNWLRLPGPHHTRVWWSQFLDGTRVCAGADAVACFLAWPASSSAIVPPTPVRDTAPPLTVPPAFMRDRGAGMRRLAAYVAKLPTGLRKGERRDETAYRCAAKCLEEVSAFEALRIVTAWNAYNAEPLSEKEIAKVVANAGKYRRGAA